MNVYGCPNSLDELEIRLGDMLTGALHSQRSSSVSLQLAAPRSQRRTVLVLQFSCEAFVYIITLRPHLSYIVYISSCVCVCVCAEKDALGPQLQSQERVISCKNEEKASGSRKFERKASGKNESSVAVAAKDRYSIILYHT